MTFVFVIREAMEDCLFNVIVVRGGIACSVLVSKPSPSWDVQKMLGSVEAA